MNLKNELINSLEVRLKQLTGEIDLGYKLHSGHHTRDIVTVLAFLKDDPTAQYLIKNMPKSA